MSRIATLIKQCRNSTESTQWIQHSLEKLLQMPAAYKTAHGSLHGAIPYKVEFSGKAVEAASSARIWIKFKTIGNPERTAIYEEHTDVVPLTSLHDPFPVSVAHPSRFALELGSKLIPIQIFHVHEDRGKKLALFIKMDSLAQIIQSPRNQVVSLQTYACSVDILHHIHGADKKEIEKKIIRLMSDYREIREKSSIKIPGFLKLKKISVSATSSQEEALKALSQTVAGKQDFTKSMSQLMETETELDIFRFMRGI